MAESIWANCFSVSISNWFSGYAHIYRLASYRELCSTILHPTEFSKMGFGSWSNKKLTISLYCTVGVQLNQQGNLCRANHCTTYFVCVWTKSILKVQLKLLFIHCFKEKQNLIFARQKITISLVDFYYLME